MMVVLASVVNVSSEVLLVLYLQSLCMEHVYVAYHRSSYSSSCIAFQEENDAAPSSSFIDALIHSYFSCGYQVFSLSLDLG